MAVWVGVGVGGSVGRCVVWGWCGLGGVDRGCVGIRMGTSGCHHVHSRWRGKVLAIDQPWAATTTHSRPLGTPIASPYRAVSPPGW